MGKGSAGGMCEGLRPTQVNRPKVGRRSGGASFLSTRMCLSGAPEKKFFPGLVLRKLPPGALASLGLSFSLHSPCVDRRGIIIVESGKKTCCDRERREGQGNHVISRATTDSVSDLSIAHIPLFFY